MPGTKYRLGERIGAGGMAEVFRAHTVGTQGFERLVAIKRVLPHWSANPHYAEQFVNEARIMASLRHPNVVAVWDFARDDEQRLFLVMELVEGVALSRLACTGPVPLPVAVYIACEMLRGLGHVHDRMDDDGNPLGLVHHDLSANNVLLSWDGAVKISDFGLAKAYAGTSGEDSGAYGTPGYMSPEQINGGTIDRRSDLFAAGVILYALLTGTMPFGGTNRIQLDLAVLCQPVEPPRSLRSEIPADLEALTLQLLERDPKMRPASAQAALEALERCEAASHVGRTQLIALLQEHFAAHGPTKPARGDALSALELLDPVPEAANAPQARSVQVPIPSALRSRGEQEKAHADEACALAPFLRDAPRSHTRSGHPSPGTTRNGKRWVWATVVLVVLGIMASSKLLPHGSDSTAQTEVVEAAPPDESVTPSTALMDTDSAQASTSPLPELDTTPPAEIPIVERRTPTARVTPGLVMDLSRAGDTSPLANFVKEAR
jgi:serine/threonine protein kinase